MFVAAFIGLVQFSTDAEALPDFEVRLLEPEPAPPVREPLQPIELPPPLERQQSLVAPMPVPLDEPEPEPEADPPTDWYAQIPDVARSVVSSQQTAPSVNPAFDAKRREAAARYGPSRAPVKKPIWENVTTDQLGRKILVAGDCHRIVDDSSAARYEIFETFYQYITFCAHYDRPPEELPWVEDVRSRRPWLAAGLIP